MIASRDFFERVDMTTTDSGLAELMITDYPGLIQRGQYKTEKPDSGKRVYRFYSLNKQTLLGFLEPHRNAFKYEISFPHNGEPL